jgi:hypothetical protein
MEKENKESVDPDESDPDLEPPPYEKCNKLLKKPIKIFSSEKN